MKNSLQTVAIVAGTSVSIFVSSLIGMNWLVKATTATMRIELGHVVMEVREIGEILKSKGDKDHKQDERILVIEGDVKHLKGLTRKY